MGFVFQTDSNSVVKLIKKRKDADILKRIPKQLINQFIYMQAVKANGLSIKDVPPEKRTTSMILYAIRENHQAYFYIKDQNQHYLNCAVRSLIKKIMLG
jgi:hypothetical protein